ncbi:hypothetical protein cypCar_00038335, partial [Cyprinus carpio]
MISKHADGSLNQWAVSFAEDSAFSAVLSISHKSRYCGHRFHLNDLACHSLLPLLLTTSHHNALRTPAAALTAPARRSRVSQDPSAVYSELILWRVDPVGPLSFSGGVSELARINSLHASAFSNVAWLPTLIPSNCLGVYGNSPSACFIASDGRSLRLYQAIIEAKKLLSELSNPDISKYVGEVFNIISQQSTARPGCIIELDAITDFQGKETQLLHVFEEDLILGSEKVDDCLQDSEQTQTPDRESVSPSPVNSSQFNFETVGSPQTPRPKLKTSNLQSACRLALTNTKVFSQELDLPQGVEVMRVSPAAGHLSASSLQPAGRSPYLLATSCSDGSVRFWRCSAVSDPDGSADPSYVWRSGLCLWRGRGQQQRSECGAVRLMAQAAGHTSRVGGRARGART